MLLTIEIMPPVTMLVNARPKLMPANAKQKKDNSNIPILSSVCSTNSFAYQSVKKTNPTPSLTILISKNIQQRIKSDLDHQEDEVKFTIFSEKVIEATNIPRRIVKKNFPRSKR